MNEALPDSGLGGRDGEPHPGAGTSPEIVDHLWQIAG